jgi:hypothetical protein
MRGSTVLTMPCAMILSLLHHDLETELLTMDWNLRSLPFKMFCQVFCHSNKKSNTAGCQWLTPVIFTTQEAGIRRIMI